MFINFEFPYSWVTENGPTAMSALAVDVWTYIWPRPVPSSLYTKCNSPPVNGVPTLLFDVALPLHSKGLTKTGM